MSRVNHPGPGAAGQPLLYCDLTQSWSDIGGGVGTYLRHKRAHILARTDASHLMILPGPEDATIVEENGRAITCFIASRRVPASPHYRLLLRNGAVRSALETHRPHLIECQDAYNLPWAAIGHARRHPGTALVAAYMTDFPTVYVERPFTKAFGETIGRAAAKLCYRYCGSLFRRFDTVYALSEHGGGAKLRALGVDPVHVVPLGVELGEFSPDKRDQGLRARLGLSDDQPMLIYAGRLDIEKRPQTVVDAFLALPKELGAHLVLIGDGPLREPMLERARGSNLHALGYVHDRTELARWLASADIYVSGMADETFGISIIEAQASGLPVVGIAAGAMLDRVPPALGRTGAIGDSAQMAANILAVWQSDRRAMGEAARIHAERFSWQESMSRLFGEIYVEAVARAAARAGSAPISGGVPVRVPVR